MAQQLHLSEKTIGRHLANIYAKLGVSTRTAAAGVGACSTTLLGLTHLHQVFTILPGGGTKLHDLADVAGPSRSA